LDNKLVEQSYVTVVLLFEPDAFFAISRAFEAAKM